MARKDERGVVIPAPLQFNNPASAGLPRYDDEHRGPAVTDAYELSHCWIDLAEHSAEWQVPDKLPPRMAELAMAVPDDQRADWLRTQANREEVDRLLSSAMRSGDLPIWVAPIGEPERLVAPGAIVEVDHSTLVSGVYRPLNDRGWLHGRPLFVKRDDWVRFVAEVKADKCFSVAPDPDKLQPPPDEPFVTLSHALTWIAFGVSMDSDQLHEVLSLDRYGEHIPQEALSEAVARLTALGSGGKIAMRGKYRESRHDNEKILLTAAIDPIRLEDYRQFSYLDDELRHGEGLLFWRNDDGTVLDYIFGDGRKDSFLQVKVNRADLLRAIRPRQASSWEPDAIHWSDLGAPELARAQQLARDAEADEWWNWPQAATWVDARNLEHIATMRLCAEPWKRKSDYDPAVALGAERYLGSAYSADPEGAERDLQRAIERGAIRTLGRATPDSVSHELKPLDWRGGEVVYNRTATLVSTTNLLSEWACDIAVNRSDLWREFQPDNWSEPVVGAPAERAPSVKSGRPPSDDEILTKADEMKARGLRSYQIASQMRLEAKFENVSTTQVRELVKGRWKPSGRPREKDA